MLFKIISSWQLLNFFCFLFVEPRGGRNVGRPIMRWKDQYLNADKTGLNT